MKYPFCFLFLLFFSFAFGDNPQPVQKQTSYKASYSMKVYKEHVFWVEKPTVKNPNGSVEEVETITSDKCLPFSKEEIMFSL